tara:strand:+ start:1940 stop:2548 length:609 start_codon:yes stop_codon:yes gene_type:complete
MNKFLVIILSISFSFLLNTNNYASENTNKIAILVNDNVITNYDIEQRVKIFAILNQMQITPENSSIITSNIVDELIDALLKTEEIKEYDINIGSSDLDYYENQYFRSRGLDKKVIFELMKINNININEFYEMLYNDIAWQTLIGRLYYRVTSISDEEIEELMKNDPELTIELAEKIIMDKQLALKGSKMLRDLRSEATIEYK